MQRGGTMKTCAAAWWGGEANALLDSSESGNDGARRVTFGYF